MEKEKKEEKIEEKKEEKKKINLGKIVASIIMCIAISISIFIIVQSFGGNKEKYQKQLDAVVDELNTLKSKNNEIFKNEGLTKEYYDNESRISSLTQKKWDLERKTKDGFIVQNIVFAILPLVFGGIFSVISYNIFNRKQIVNEHLSNLERIGKSIGEGYAEATGSPSYVALKCPECGANLKGEKIEKCPYCGTVLEKVRKK